MLDTRWASTNSLTGPPPSTNPSSDTNTSREKEIQTSQSRTSLPPSTGEQRVQLPKLRTKDNADHAGPSQLLVQLREPWLSRLETSNHSLSNNLLTATESKTKDAMVDSWTMPSNTLSQTHSSLSLHTHTTPRERLANMSNLRVLVKLLASKMSRRDQLTNLELLLLMDQSPLLLRP